VVAFVKRPLVLLTLVVWGWVILLAESTAFAMLLVVTCALLLLAEVVFFFSDMLLETGAPLWLTDDVGPVFLDGSSIF
jgi:hypothetical protein